jgi:hypothetical protein
VHVDAERRRRGVGGEQPLVACRLEQRPRSEVAGGAQLIEVLGEERVLAVVLSGTLADAAEQLGRQSGHASSLSDAPPSLPA